MLSIRAAAVTASQSNAVQRTWFLGVPQGAGHDIGPPAFAGCMCGAIDVSVLCWANGGAACKVADSFDSLCGGLWIGPWFNPQGAAVNFATVLWVNVQRLGHRLARVAVCQYGVSMTAG